MGLGILGQDRVQNAVGHLVAELIGMALGNALRGEKFLHRHIRFLISFDLR